MAVALPVLRETDDRPLATRKQLRSPSKCQKVLKENSLFHIWNDDRAFGTRMQDLNDIAYFASVVENKGFSAAARVLGLPKSTLSRHVSQLEERLGMRLLERSTRHF